MRDMIFLAVFLALCVCAGGTARAARASLDVAVFPGADRVERDEDISSRPRVIRISAAANEYEPFQVAVQATGGPVRNIKVEVTDLRMRNSRNRIDDIALHRIHYLYVLQTSGGYAFLKKIEYPGPVLPFNHPDGRPYAAPFDNTRIGSPAKPWRKAKDGPGFVFTSGAYKGSGDRSYVVQIQKTGNAGLATFRWSDSWQGGLDSGARVAAWNAENVRVPTFGKKQRGVPVKLNDGVEVVFNRGAKKDGPDFVSGHTYHFRVYEQMNEVIWGDVRVPPGTPPGLYEGKLTVAAQGHPRIEIPIELTVWSFELPKDRTIIGAYHGGMGGGYFAGRPKDMNWRYELLCHNHRVDPQRIPGAGVGGWNNLEGKWDWSKFDAEVSKRLDGSAFPDGAGLKGFVFGLYGPGSGWHWDFYAKKKVENVEIMGRRFAAHLKKKGWLDKTYLYCSDEPYPGDDPNIVRDIKAFLKGDPDWKGQFMCTTAPNPDRGLLGYVDVWCIKPHWWVKPEAWSQVRENKDKIWCYMANSPHSPYYTYHIDTLKGYEPRIAKWAAWKLGAEAFLYWAMSLNPVHPNPWVTAMSDYGVTGDGTFIYAGARNGPSCNDNATPLPPYEGPIADFRVKQIREGMEDWEYLNMYEKKKGRTEGIRIAWLVHKREGLSYGSYPGEEALDNHWTQDSAKIYEAREMLAKELMGIKESSPFKVSKPFLKLWLQGRGHREKAFVAIVDQETGRELMRSHGEADGRFRPVAVPVDKYTGRTLMVRVVSRDPDGKYEVEIKRLGLSDDDNFSSPPAKTPKEN